MTVDSQRGEVADVFEDGDGQFTLDDAVTTIGGGILTGDRYLASQSLGFHRLESAEGGAVIGGDYGVDIIAGGGEDVFHQLEGIGGIPVVDPLIGNDFDLVHVGLRGLQSDPCGRGWRCCRWGSHRV